MAVDKLEIKISKDSKNNEALLESMSLEVASAFLTVVDAFTKIVQHTPNNDNLKIGVDSDSVSTSIYGSEVVAIKNDFVKVISRQTSDSEIVEPWRNIQTLFQRNGLSYTAMFTTDDKPTDIYERLKNNKRLLAKAVKKPKLHTNIVFFKGILVEAGGKNKTNIHLDTHSDLGKITIACSRESAVKSIRFLYKDIFVSAWQSVKGNRIVYDLCESYFPAQYPLYKRLKDFVEAFKKANDEVDSLSKVHDECRYYLDNRLYGQFRKFIRLFLHPSTDVNVIYTILLLTQFFESNERLKDILAQLEALFQQKMADLNE